MMKSTYLEEARKVIPEIPVLVNVVSKRVRQLNQGYPPLVEITGSRSDFADIALREIIEGKIEWDIPEGAAEELEV